MKKIIVMISALVMVFAFTACGGGEGDGDGGRTYAGYYTAVIPEDFEVNETENQFVRPYPEDEDKQQMIHVNVLYGSAEEAVADTLKIFDDQEQGEDVVTGDRTWLTVPFEFNGVGSCKYYTDIEEDYYVEVVGFMLPPDDETIMGVLESMTFEEGAYDLNGQFLRGELE